MSEIKERRLKQFADVKLSMQSVSHLRNNLKWLCQFKRRRSPDLAPHFGETLPLWRVM